VNAGLEDVLQFLESYRFAQDDVDYLASSGLFSHDFLHYLTGVQFSGTVRAIPEGRVFFLDEPVLEITAPIIEAPQCGHRALHQRGIPCFKEQCPECDVPLTLE